MMNSPVIAEVAQNLQARAHEREHGRICSQHLKTALVVQGGVLRGIASCAAAAALNHLTLTNAFDAVYGISSGALNAAYFLTGQAARAVAAYPEMARDRRLINFLRVNRIVDLDYLFDEIVVRRTRHDIAKLLHHPTELLVGVVDLETGEPVWFSSKKDGPDLYQIIKASCALPLVIHKGITVANRHCADFYIHEPIPLTKPLEDGYTDILVLLTRHVSFREDERSTAARLLLDPIVRMQLPSCVHKHYKNRHRRYNWAANVIEAGLYATDDQRSTRIAYVCPDLRVKAGRWQRNPARLLEVAYSSWKNCTMLFGKPADSTRSVFEKVIREASHDI